LTSVTLAEPFSLHSAVVDVGIFELLPIIRSLPFLPAQNPQYLNNRSVKISTHGKYERSELHRNETP
jgi:hypothetical protein